MWHGKVMPEWPMPRANYRSKYEPGHPAAAGRLAFLGHALGMAPGESG